MLISNKQHEANRQNAQHSCGPTTEAGKAAVRYNALKYGLRTAVTFVPGDNKELYYKVWDEFEAEWQPQTRTERAYLETMVTSQWLLRRMAQSERDIYLDHPGDDGLEERLKLLAQVYKFRAQLERSFRSAVADMTKSQEKRVERERQAQPQPIQPAPTAEPAPAPVPAPTPVEPNRTWLTRLMPRANGHQPPPVALNASPDSR